MKGKEYVNYIAQFSLTILAVSAAYMFDPSNLITLLAFIPVPLLFGYTAFSSSQRFRYSSLLSLFALVFLTIDKLAPVAIIVGIGNPLVSLLSGGDSFSDYYKAVSIPMLLTGLILGTAVFAAASNDAEIRNTVQSTAGDIISSQTSNVLEETELIEKQKEANDRMVRGISKGAITMTQSYVRNETETLNQEQQQNIVSAFSKAQREVPGRLLNKTGENNKTAVDISKRASESIETAINKENLIILIPVIGLGLYAFHPVIGLLTAIFGMVFSRLGRNFQSLKD